MQIAKLDKASLHWREDGHKGAKPVIFANSLGTDLRLWDHLIPLLPNELRLIRYDKRGHGLSSCPPAPYTIDDLVDDTFQLLNYLAVENCVFVGLSIGGMIGQGLAVKHPELVSGLVLSNTAPKMGDRQIWQARMSAIKEDRFDELVPGILERWFSPQFHQMDEFERWKNMLARTPQQGYLGCCAALSEADLTSSLKDLTLPTLGIGGDLDGASPPEQVEAMIHQIRNAKFELIEGAGHLPPVEQPELFAKLLMQFLEEIDYV